jgi:putative salt-induced outer membrane protein
MRQYEIAEQSDYTMEGGRYWFGAFDYNANRFSTTRSRMSEVVGYGMRVLDTGEHVFDVQLGAGRRQSRFDDRSTRDETILSFGTSYLWRLSRNADISEQFTVEHGQTNTYSESVTELRSKLSNKLALSIAYSVRHNSEVPAANLKTDSTTLMSVIYSF